MKYFTLFPHNTKLEELVYFTLTAHLSPDKPHLNCSTVIYG